MLGSLEFLLNAGSGGFWIHRVLQQEGIEGHVVDPASIATNGQDRHDRRQDAASRAAGLPDPMGYGYRPVPRADGGCYPLTLEVIHVTRSPSRRTDAIRTNLGAICVSLELSRSTWLITSLSPCGGEKTAKHSVSAGDIARCWCAFRSSRRRRSRGSGSPSQSS